MKYRTVRTVGPRPARSLARTVAVDGREVWRCTIWLVALLLAALASFGALTGQQTAATGPDTAVATAPEEGAAEEAGEFDFFGNLAPVNIEQLRQMQQQFAELAADVANATVNVQVGGSQGSGVIVTRDGYVMTAAHVIGGANLDATVTLPDGTQLEAKTLGLNRTIDSGLLKITAKGKYDYLSPGESSTLRTGQWVMAIGHPGGWDPDRKLVYRIGRVLTVNENVIRTDCSLVGGDSGGPLVDMDGNVIGIHSRIGASLSSNVHVPVDVYSSEWDDLASGRDWGRGIGGENPANEPWIGLALKDRTLEIESVSSDGPAADAGLQPGDVILEIDGNRITSFRRFAVRAATLNPGDRITVKYQRGDEELETELLVASRADDN